MLALSGRRSRVDDLEPVSLTLDAAARLGLLDRLGAVWMEPSEGTPPFRRPDARSRAYVAPLNRDFFRRDTTLQVAGVVKEAGGIPDRHARSAARAFTLAAQGPRRRGRLPPRQLDIDAKIAPTGGDRVHPAGAGWRGPPSRAGRFAGRPYGRDEREARMERLLFALRSPASGHGEFQRRHDRLALEAFAAGIRMILRRRITFTHGRRGLPGIISAQSVRRGGGASK